MAIIRYLPLILLLLALPANAAQVQYTTGSKTPGDCVQFDSNGYVIDAGAACGSSFTGGFSNGSQASPSIYFTSDTGTGIYWSSSHNINFSLNGSNQFSVGNGGYFKASNANGSALVNTAASATAPTILPNVGDTKAGIGANSSGNVSVVVDNSGSGLEDGRFTTAGAFFPNGGVGIGTTSLNTGLGEDKVIRVSRQGPTSYPANYAPACTSCTYQVLDMNATGNDASIVFRDTGNARAEIGLVGDDNIHFKTVAGTYNTEAFSDRMIILGTGSGNPGNVGIGTTLPLALLDVGTGAGQDCQIDYVGDLFCTASVGAINLNGSAVITANGEKTQGTGPGYRLRNPIDGTFGYFAGDTYINNTTNYHQVDIQAPLSDGTICMDAGAGASTPCSGIMIGTSNTVSIGTSTQNGALNVNGTINASSLALKGATSGALTITPQSVVGTPTWTAGTSSGTPAVTASAPLAITTATGNITCATCLTGNQTITLSGDTTGSGTTAITTTTVKVNGVSYGTSPSTNTVPVVTGTNSITYETVPNAALTNSAITFGATSTSLGGTVSGLNSVTIGAVTPTTGAFTSLSATGTLDNISTVGNAVLTVNGHEQSGGGAYLRVRDDTLGTVGYFGQNSVINGGTAYSELLIQNPQSSGTICISGNANGSSTANTNCDLYDDGSDHVLNRSGQTPTVATGASDCGTSPTIAGSDNVAVITVGSSTNGGKCTVTFAHNWPNAPACIAQNQTSAARPVFALTPSVSGVTITASGTISAADKISLICNGY